MANTYVSASAYDVGCDDCGETNVFYNEDEAREWADTHECAA